MSVGIEALRKCELFKAIDDALLEEFLELGEVRSYAADDVVYAEMAQSDEFILVVEGRLLHTFALLDAGGVDYEMAVAPGEVSNVVRVLEEGPNYVSCVADIDTKAVVWKAHEVVEFWDKHPESGYHVCAGVAKMLYQQVQQFNQILLDRVSWGLE